MNDNEEEYMEIFEANNAAFSEALPRVVRDFQKDAVKVSHHNDIPAAISFFTILGQIAKDFIQIPNGRSIEDSRIHFCWVQTSGTGKSTLWNFVGPVSKAVHKKINELNQHPPRIGEGGVVIPKTFNIFGLTDYTDSVLLGTFDKETNDDGEVEYLRRPGVLEGSGLAHWDEFEYSGIFKQTQHKENSIVYLNTLMNTLVGESWVISKGLTSYGGEIMECYCERSIIAMTYPPSNLTDIMAEKGVLQRMLTYVWDVPEFIQDKMRREQLSKAGVIEEINQPIEKYANALFNLYKTIKDRYDEVDQNPLKVMRYSKEFNDVLTLEYENMKAYIDNTRPEVRAIASNFTTRLLKILIKLSVLCSVAQSPSIKNKHDRFNVTGHNVRQAANITRQCYMTLVDWLERSLRVKRQATAEASLKPAFLEIYAEMEKDSEEFVNKTMLLTKVQNTVKKSRAQVQRYFSKIQHNFEIRKVGRTYFVKLIEGDEK